MAAPILSYKIGPCQGVCQKIFCLTNKPGRDIGQPWTLAAPILAHYPGAVKDFFVTECNGGGYKLLQNK